MNKPWLSVVIPTFNGAGYIEHALASVAAQELEGVEVVVADDGSTDGTLDIIGRFGATLRLRLIHRGGDGSWTRGCNRGLAEATGRYVCFLHQDDAWLPGRLSRVRVELARKPVPTLLLHSVLFIDERGRSLGRWRCPLPVEADAIDPDLFLERLLVQNFVPFPGHVLDTEVVRRSGGFDTMLWFTADWDLWLRTGRMGPVRYLEEPLAEYRIHGSSLTASRPSEEMRKQTELVFERHMAAWQASPTRKRQVAEAARFSVDLNTALAGAARGQSVRWATLLKSALRLGPAGWRRYLRDSRIVERLGARIRARA